MSGKHFKNNNEETIDEVNIINENNESSEELNIVNNCNENCDSCDCSKNNEEDKNKIINLEIEIQDLKQQLVEAQEEIKQKDEIINAQAQQVNLYITRYNKDEVTIDALQDKLLTIINAYNIKN